jgi:hypothetical protein
VEHGRRHIFRIDYRAAVADAARIPNSWNRVPVSSFRATDPLPTDGLSCCSLFEWDSWDVAAVAVRPRRPEQLTLVLRGGDGYQPYAWARAGFQINLESS